MRAVPLPRRLRRSLAIATIASAGALSLGLGLVTLDHRPMDAPAAPTAARAPATVAGPFAAAFERGLANLRSGDAHGALRAFEEARRLRPHVAAVNSNIGFALLALSRPKQALEQFEAALELRPDLANAYYGLASAQELLGDLDAARGAMRTYLHLSDLSDEKFRRRAAAALWEWGDADRANAAAEPPAPGAPARGAPVNAARFAALVPGEDPLARFEGDLVVLNVWALWCAPCRAELPALQALSEELGDTDVRIVGINIDENPAIAREFLEDENIRFENLSDPDGGLIGPRIPTDALPVTVVLGRDGSVLAEGVGYRDWSDPAVRDALELLAASSAPQDEVAQALRRWFE